MSPNRLKRHTLLGLCMAAAALAAPLAAQAQEITLNAVNAFHDLRLILVQVRGPRSYG